MKTIVNAGLCVAMLGAMGLAFAAQETPAASSGNSQQAGPNNQEADEEILQKSVWRRYFGEDFDIFIGEPIPRPQPPLPGPARDPFFNYPAGHSEGIAKELEFIEHLWSENDMVDEYKALAKRPYLSEMDQVLFVNSAYSGLDFDRNITEVLVALIVNPSFSEGGRDAILEGMNAGKIRDMNRRKKIFEVLENRGEPLPSPRNPQRWIGYHFSRFQRAIHELQGKSMEFERRILALEKRPVPPIVDISGFDKRLGVLEKRNLLPEEFNKRISVLESRIQAPVELERRISALEKAVQRRVEPAPGTQPAQMTELQKQVADLEAKVKQLEADVKKQAPRPRVPEKTP